MVLCTFCLLNLFLQNVIIYPWEDLKMSEMIILGIGFIGGLVITFMITRFSFYIVKKVFDKSAKQ